jgi:hypothetical protein
MSIAPRFRDERIDIEDARQRYVKIILYLKYFRAMEDLVHDRDSAWGLVAPGLVRRAVREDPPSRDDTVPLLRG